MVCNSHPPALSFPQKVVGHYCGPQAKAWHWLAALNKAVNRQFPQGVRGSGLHLMSDNGTQPTALSFMKACRDMGITQAFTSYNNPKGNADTERFIRTLKEELVWINEWNSPSLFSKSLDRWFEYYNHNYLHSSLGYQPPAAFEQDELSRGTLLESVC
jgi:putative transposase